LIHRKHLHNTAQDQHTLGANDGNYCAHFDGDVGDVCEQIDGQNAKPNDCANFQYDENGHSCFLLGSSHVHCLTQNNDSLPVTRPQDTHENDLHGDTS
jgi:hypothetical protein